MSVDLRDQGGWVPGLGGGVEVWPGKQCQLDPSPGRAWSRRSPVLVSSFWISVSCTGKYRVCWWRQYMF